jgi:HSP20 family molecular chaperone IbpA
MLFRDKRVWFILNALLAAGIVVLVAWLLADHWLSRGAPAGSHATAAPGSSSAVRREVDAGRVGVRPVSFAPNALSSEAPEVWRMRGMHPREWARLPASPGMDMAETPEGFLLTFSLPGVRNEDVRLTMTGRVVTVHAVVRDPHGNQVGGMERRVLLPRAPGDPSGFKALYTNGVLRICVAK